MQLISQVFSRALILFVTLVGRAYTTAETEVERCDAKDGLQQVYLTESLLQAHLAGLEKASVEGGAAQAPSASGSDSGGDSASEESSTG
mmetsp:Transcript_21347/g.47765  ORF Transcript_21347/g.47765 Transcript_21347/m.47765 type:complete len:89 (-) Transcript_21347:157-423(-)